MKSPAVSWAARPSPRSSLVASSGWTLAESDGKVTRATACWTKGPAGKAGLKAGDQIAEFNGPKVQNDAGTCIDLPPKMSGEERQADRRPRQESDSTITVKAGEGL